MIYFTNYANQKFDILNNHKVYFTREDVEGCLTVPEKSGKKGKYFWAQKEKIKVLYRKEGDIIKVYTFYPIK
jgi:hypothetical protein